MTKNRPPLSIARKKESGQNVIEYILVTATVVLICIVFFNPASGPARTGMENVLNQTVSGIDSIRSEIQF